MYLLLLDSSSGMEKLDGICMLLMAIGEGFKNIDKITGRKLLKKYPEVDWTGIKGFRDIVAHHYFDIDAEQVFYIITNRLDSLAATVKKMISELQLLLPHRLSHSLFLFDRRYFF